jgi:hypothetical protein
VIRVTYHEACGLQDGEAHGRHLLAEALHARHGGQDAAIPYLATLNVTQIAAAALWLRDTAIRIGMALGVQATMLRPRDGEAITLDQWRGWELSHEFLCETGPGAQRGRVTICCHGCLLTLATGVAATAAALACDDFSGDWVSAANYALAGGSLPAYTHDAEFEDAPRKEDAAPVPEAVP